MNIRQANLKMIKAFPGGKDALAAAMGMTPHAFDNRVYGRKGQAFDCDEQLAIQSFSETTYFAEAVANLSRGVFVKLPAVADVGNDELLAKWNEVYAQLGELSSVFRAAIADGEVDIREQVCLVSLGNEVHKCIEELLALTFKVYSRKVEGSNA